MCTNRCRLKHVLCIHAILYDDSHSFISISTVRSTGYAKIVFDRFSFLLVNICSIVSERCMVWCAGACVERVTRFNVINEIMILFGMKQMCVVVLYFSFIECRNQMRNNRNVFFYMLDLSQGVCILFFNIIIYTKMYCVGDSSHIKLNNRMKNKYCVKKIRRRYRFQFIIIL